MFLLRFTEGSRERGGAGQTQAAVTAQRGGSEQPELTARNEAVRGRSTAAGAQQAQTGQCEYCGSRLQRVQWVPLIMSIVGFAYNEYNGSHEYNGFRLK